MVWDVHVHDLMTDLEARWSAAQLSASCMATLETTMAVRTSTHCGPMASAPLFSGHEAQPHDSEQEEVLQAYGQSTCPKAAPWDGVAYNELCKTEGEHPPTVSNLPTMWGEA